MNLKHLVTAICVAIGVLATLTLLWLLGGSGRTVNARQVLTALRVSARRTTALSKGIPLAATSARRYVSITGTDDGDCTTPAGACRTLQYAVDQAADGDEIRVAMGRYTDVSVRPGQNITAAEIVTQVVYVSKTVAIHGGYTTTNWTNPDPEVYTTTLDAQKQGRVIYITGPISPLLEGLHIVGGDESTGGGVYVFAATVTFKDNRVYDCSSSFRGGGLYVNAGKVNIVGNTISANEAWNGGGGLFLNDSQALLVGNALLDNWAFLAGGGLGTSGGKIIIVNNTIDANHAGFSRWGFGGGIDLWNSAAELFYNTISSNTAIAYGGGFHLTGGTVTLGFNTITTNTASLDGGGLFLSDSTAQLFHNKISNNHGSLGIVGSGAGLYIYGGEATLNGNVIDSNSGVCQGGGLAVLNNKAMLTNNTIAENEAACRGSGMFIADASARLLHNTLSRNGAPELTTSGDGDGSGIYVAGPGGAHGPSTVHVTNTILVSHGIGITVAAGSTATLQATLWGNGRWANGSDWGGGGTIITGTRDVRGDPAFLNPDSGDYHIDFTSAAIDAGVEADIRTDIDHEPRPYRSPDLGADEYWPPGALEILYLPLVIHVLP